MLIECRKSSHNSLIYQEGLFFIYSREDRSKYSRKGVKNSTRKFGILLFGIDSVSQFNARRTMPRVVRYMEARNWYELSGYNKIGDNTFPNLMAILTGFNLSDTQKICQPRLSWGLSNCSTLFKTLRQQGFTTAFAEDECGINTFNFGKAGFRHEPTDYYQRPLLLALEDRLMYQKHYGSRFCISQKRYAEYIYDFGLEFAERHLGKTIFGLFWINSVSHNSWHGPLAIQERILGYLQELHAKRIFEHNVVVFFSDHGSRWGYLRNRKSGFIEERLPMFFMWLPKWFKKCYPEADAALRQNKHRLTSPYDFHATLKHLSVLAQGKSPTTLQTLPAPQGCLTCQSLLKSIPEDRSCSQAGIEDYWCTCTPFYSVDTKSYQVREISKTLIHHINTFLKVKNITNLCRKLTLKTVEAANIKMNIKSGNHTDYERTTYRITFTVYPSDAKFDASYHLNYETKGPEINVETISRLNSYAKDSQCVKDVIAKKFCICSDSIRTADGNVPVNKTLLYSH
uniref:Sulfatase N-terminal domain-containing protein n=1 Tax=Glossina pallidipes TaxID=7398 RepID=A0A1B0AG14_GLOPL